MRSLVRSLSALALAGLALVASAAPADAAFSTISFNDSANPSVNGSDLISSTSFTIGDLFAKGASATNLFVGTPSVDFGTTIINVNAINSSATPTTLFGNSLFGTFQATSAVIFGASMAAPGTESLSIYVLGTFTPGTSNAGSLGTTMATPASFTIAFTQNGSAYNDSSILSIPPAASPVPEPASFALLGLGLAGLGGFGASRRRAAR